MTINSYLLIQSYSCSKIAGQNRKTVKMALLMTAQQKADFRAKLQVLEQLLASKDKGKSNDNGDGCLSAPQDKKKGFIFSVENEPLCKSPTQKKNFQAANTLTPGLMKQHKKSEINPQTPFRLSLSPISSSLIQNSASKLTDPDILNIKSEYKRKNATTSRTKSKSPISSNQSNNLNVKSAVGRKRSRASTYLNECEISNNDGDFDNDDGKKSVKKNKSDVKDSGSKDGNEIDNERRNKEAKIADQEQGYDDESRNANDETFLSFFEVEKLDQSIGKVN